MVKLDYAQIQDSICNSTDGGVVALGGELAFGARPELEGPIS